MFVGMSQYLLISDLVVQPRQPRRMFLAECSTLLLYLVQEQLKVVSLHKQYGPTNKLQQVNILTEFGSHVIVQLERSSPSN